MWLPKKIENGSIQCCCGTGVISVMYVENGGTISRSFDGGSSQENVITRWCMIDASFLAALDDIMSIAESPYSRNMTLIDCVFLVSLDDIKSIGKCTSPNNGIVSWCRIDTLVLTPPWMILRTSEGSITKKNILSAADDEHCYLRSVTPAVIPRTVDGPPHQPRQWTESFPEDERSFQKKRNEISIFLSYIYFLDWLHELSL